MKNYICPQGPKFSGSYSSSNNRFGGAIKVVSYNVKYGRKVELAIRELQTYDELYDADIVLLQEMDTAGAERVARTLNYNYIYYPASLHGRHQRDFGNSIITKWPISQGQKIILPHHNPINRQKRIATVATIHLGIFDILTYSVHTETSWMPRQKRLDQIDSIASSIPPDWQHVIVGGDFNTAFQRCLVETERLFGEIGLQRASDSVGPTHRVARLGLLKFHLDHVFTKGLCVIDSGVIPQAVASDHYPVWLLLQPELN
jgi:endonuclease/exonuclease/phosphatase family metal-dependent hydrolase